MADVEALNLEPVPTLLRRVREELADSFRAGKPVRVSRAPGRLDVMGGIADYTGSLVCEATLDVAAAVALQERDDRQLQIFSFNLFDDHHPFTFQIPLDALASNTAETLRREFAQPGRKWAGYLAGCLFMLHEQRFINLSDPKIRGVNLALYSTVPMGAGVSSSAAIEVATLMNLVDHFGLRHQYNPDGRSLLDPLKLAWMCQQVENRIVGAPCGIMDQVASALGEEHTLLRLHCQPHELLDPLHLPQGIHVVGINSNVRHSVGGGSYGRTRCAAFMGHTLILAKMEEIGLADGKTLTRDPMNGYLANLPLPDYKKYFRQFLPDTMKGIDFLEKHGPTIDTATVVNPDTDYAIQHATDHHVYEASRVRNFVKFIEEAARQTPGTRERSTLLDKAGHLMYASHVSYRDDAMLSAEECDVLVELVRKNERSGLYGAKITGGGQGGTVAVLCEASSRADEAVDRIMQEYAQQTGRKPQRLAGSSPGAWHVGTAIF